MKAFSEPMINFPVTDKTGLFGGKPRVAQGEETVKELFFFHSLEVEFNVSFLDNMSAKFSNKLFRG